MTPEGPDRLGQRPDREIVMLTRDDFKGMIREALREEFTACGILAGNDEQKVEMQEDFSFLRSCRKAFGSLVGKIGTAVVLGVIGVIGTFLIAGFNIKFGK